MNVTTAEHMNVISDAFITKDIDPFLIKFVNEILKAIALFFRDFSV
jgi:hypothetical protein